MNPKKIGNKLVSLRGEKTQAEVAKAVGVSVSSIAMYENGQRTPRDEVKVSLANYYGVDIASLFYDADVCEK